MSVEVKGIEGIGSEYSIKLANGGIHTIEELLAVGADDRGRRDISSRTGIPLGFIDNWVGMADLTRVDGIGFQFAELLFYAGVKSVKDLRKRNADNLFFSIQEINRKKKLTKIIPSVEKLERFIQSSKNMTNVLH